MTDRAEPAFPCSNEQFTHGNPQTGDAWSGMSKREYYAGQALTGLLASNATYGGRTDNREALAQDAVRFADALLVALA